MAGVMAGGGAEQMLIFCWMRKQSRMGPAVGTFRGSLIMTYLPW